MRFKVAVVQQALADNDKRKSWSDSEAHIREAVAMGAQLVLLQELHATRYFCQYEDPAVFELAEALDGETFQRCRVLAEQLDVVIVMSQFERRAPGLYHNTAQVLDGKHGCVGRYRKMHIPDDPGFYEKYYFTPGDSVSPNYGFEPIKTRLGKLGVLVCWDQWYPEAARLMALNGADLLLYPTAIGWDLSDTEDEQARQREAWITVQRAHAIANGIPVLAANRVGFEADLSGQTRGIQFWGSSFVCGPQGEILASSNSEGDAVTVTELDLARNEKIRQIWPYFRDRRVDAYPGLARRWLDD